MVADVFGDLRKLADWFSTRASAGIGARTLQMERITRRLGRAAVPLLGRELRSGDLRRREAAREGLALLADTPARARVIDELRRVVDPVDGRDTTDDLKVCALGLLAELGEKAEARFADPHAIQRRSALALAAQLDTPHDVAHAADLMIHQLADDDLVQMIEVLVESAPAAAHRLATELAARLDLAIEQRHRIWSIASVASPAPTAVAPGPRRLPRTGRTTTVSVLVDAAARLVVVASRKISGERRWRRWAVLIGANGQIEDCLHEDDATSDGDAAPLIVNLVADGYRIASTDLEHARTVVAAAARLSAGDPARLTSAYYLGRDLLDLADAHLGHRAQRDVTALTLGRAVELIADGEHARARALLARCDQDDADVAAAIAAVALAQGTPADALAPLGRAIAAEPAWPLHHWNLAVAQHQLGDLAGCYHAMRRFLATCTGRNALVSDPDQPGRIACAERMLVELERAARLAGISLSGRRRRAKRSTKRRITIR